MPLPLARFLIVEMHISSPVLCKAKNDFEILKREKACTMFIVRAIRETKP
jgi:hypothetical protein